MLKGDFNSERFEKYLIEYCRFDPIKHTWSLSKNFIFGFDVFEKETGRKIFHYHVSFVNTDCTYDQVIDELIVMESRMGQAVEFRENDEPIPINETVKIGPLFKFRDKFVSEAPRSNQPKINVREYVKTLDKE